MITPTTGVDSSGKIDAEGLIEKLKRRTRANMLGGPLKNAKCDGRGREGGRSGSFALEHTVHCMRALAQDRNLFWLVWVRNVPSKIPLILEQGQIGSLEVAQQNSGVSVLRCDEIQRGWHCGVQEVSAGSQHVQVPNDEAMRMRVPAIWVRW